MTQFQRIMFLPNKVSYALCKARKCSQAYRSRLYRKCARANCSRLGHVHSQTHRSGLGNHGRVACSRKPSHKGYLLSTTTRRKPRLRRQGLQSSRVKWPSIFSPKNNLATSRKVNFPSEGCERQAKITLLLRDCHRARWPARKCTEVLPGHIFDPLRVQRHR